MKDDGATKIVTTGALGRDIFLSGQYTIYFRPEDRDNPFRRIYSEKLAETLALVEAVRPARVLDAGGGMGRLSIPLAQNPERTVVLADLSAAMLRKAEERIEGNRMPERVNTDAAVLPFPDATFDCITALDLLCHLPDPDQGIQELRRVLKEDGTLILDNTNASPWWVLCYPRYFGWSPWKLAATLQGKGVLPPWQAIVRHYRLDEFRALLERNGFQIKDSRAYGPGFCPKWHLAVARKQTNKEDEQ